MFKTNKAFASFAVGDLEKAKTFYGKTLGLEVGTVEGMPQILELKLAGGARVMLYAKPDHTPATFTVLNIEVDDLERTVTALGERGVKFEVYRDGPVKTDERGISRDQRGPAIAWFKDPSGNILSVLQPRR